MSKQIRKSKKAEARKPVVKKERSNYKWLYFAIVAIVTFVAYWPALDNGFVNLDDDRYVYENTKWIHRSVEASQLTPDGALIKEMFAIPEGYHMGNYHPFAMLGYKLIYNAAKLDPFYYHLVNILIHVLNSLLILIFIRRLTGNDLVAFATALLFGVHSLHVESVAWISELKDLLYSFFFISSLITYLSYIDKGERKFLVFSILLFIGSLFSKGQAVSLAVTLFLLDVYRRRAFSSRLAFEKVPYFALAVIFGIIAIKAQQSMGAIQEIALYSPFERVIFASYGYITYLWKMILPLNLSAYYSYPTKPVGGSLPAYLYVYPLLVIALVALTIYSLRFSRKIFFGIAFFSVTVFLVLQLLPVGGAVMADRYTYIPSLGILYLFAEGLFYLHQRYGKTSALALLAVATITYSVLTWQRCEVWKDGMTLWSDVISKTQTVALAYNNRGVLFNELGQEKLDSVKINPAYKQQANTYFDNAISDFNNAIRLNAKDKQAWSNRGLAYWRKGSLDSAVTNLTRATELDPGYAVAWSNLGSVYYSMQRGQEALNAYERAVEANPSFADGWYNIGILRYNNNQKQEACEALRTAASLGMQHASNAFRDLCK